MHKDQRGIAHIIEIIIIAVVVIGVGAFIAWRMFSAQQNNPSASDSQTKASPCKTDDADLCKFFNSWKALNQYRMDIKMTADGVTQTSMMEVGNDGKAYHLVISLDGQPYDTITIENVTYTKDFSDGKWWKNTVPQEDSLNLKEEYEQQFEEPDVSSDKTSKYTKVGMEACGNLQCHKYLLEDSELPKEKTYLWFDTKDYQLRRTLQEAEGSVTDATFTYGTVAIAAPTPTKDLAPNQYIIPGANEPVTVPTP